MTQLKLELVDYTYAETADGEIRIHKDLFDYEPRLYWHALEHELGHQGKNILEDLLWDLKDLTNVKLHFKALGFYMKYPKLILRMVALFHVKTENNKKIIEINFVLVMFYLFYLLITILIFNL